MSSWLGLSRTFFDSAKQTIELPLKSDEAQDRERTTSLLDLCKEATPPCRLNPLLFNGHIQTFWTAMKGTDIPITYKRKTFESTSTTYPGSFAVDFVVPTPNLPPTEPDLTLPPRTTLYEAREFDLLGSDDDKPMLILLHGLAGGSNEIYLRHALRPLTLNAPSEAERWEACVVNARGCALSKITSGKLYNARATWDVRQLVEWIRQKWPRRKLFAMGFSLGANILCNYLAEEGARCPLDAAVVVSNPWNLDVSSVALQSSFLGLNVYLRTMGDSMRQLWERHEKELIAGNPAIDVEKVRKIKYLNEFDRYVQCPTWGWPTEGAYYRDASCIDSLINVRIPVFAIHAKDDPIAVDKAAPYEEVKQTPYFVLCSTTLGGHLSWFEVGGERWFSRAAASFLQKMARDVDLNTLKKERQSEAVGNGDISRYGAKPVFDPIARKLKDESAWYK